MIRTGKGSTVCKITGWCVEELLLLSHDLRLAETAAKFYVPEVERGLNMNMGIST